MARDHEKERILVVAAAAGVLGESWPVLDGLRDVNWGWLLSRARELGLSARFWAEVIRAGLDRELPSSGREELEHRAQEGAAYAALLSEAMWRAGAILDEEGIPWMPMKGAALAVVAPEYAVTRFACDVDLLVLPDDVDRAARALGATLPVLYARRGYDGAAPDVDAAIREDLQHLFLFEGAGGVPIELHHAFPGLTTRGVTDAVFSRSTSIPGRGTRGRVPSLDDLLGTTCVHVLDHHANSRSFQLRHLADVSELLARGASGERARERFDRDDRAYVARSIRELVEAKQEACARAAPSAATAAVEPGLLGRVRGWGERVRERADAIHRGVRLHGLAALVPPRSFMVSLYGPGATGPRLVLLHLHRWFAILTRTIRGG